MGGFPRSRCWYFHYRIILVILYRFHVAVRPLERGDERSAFFLPNDPWTLLKHCDVEGASCRGGTPTLRSAYSCVAVSLMMHEVICLRGGVLVCI